MREVRGIAAVILLAALAGCASTPAQATTSTLTVFLKSDRTSEQRAAVEQRLRATPEIRDISFKSREQAYQEFKEKFSAAPDLVKATRPETLPESFVSKVTDGSIVEAVGTIMTAMPGVDEVVITSSSADRTQGYVTQLSGDVTSEERAAIEREIRAMPQAKSIRFESTEAAYARLVKACRNHPALAGALQPGTAAASFRYTFTFASGASPPGIALSKLPGVRNTLNVPVSAL